MHAWQHRLARAMESRLKHPSWRDPLLIRASSADQVVFSHTFSLEPTSDSRAPDQTPFRIASVTKVYVAASIFRLVESGQLTLRDHLDRRLSPETIQLLIDGSFDPQRVTIDQLLRHTSGMTDHSISELFLRRLAEDPGHCWTRAEQIEVAMTLRGPLCEPGQRFVYSDTGYLLLGEIVERTTGLALRQAVRRLLKFEGLGLDHTDFDSREMAASLGPLAKQWLGEVCATDFDASFDLFGGGGLISTLEEIDRFYRALFGGEILSSETLTNIFMASPTDCGFDGFTHNGLMFRKDWRGHDCWGHTGHWGVLTAFFPKRGLMVAATFNSAREPGKYGADDLLNDVFESLN